MASRIEDYALIGDTRTAALVARDGSIDWLCAPRFDSPACFSALLGTSDDGRWRIAPDGDVRSVRRSYRDGTLVLETEFETADGVVALIDLMPIGDDRVDVVRIVEGRRGSVELTMVLTIRFDYGAFVPWVRRRDVGLTAVAGPDALVLRTPVATHGKGFHTHARFSVAAGDRVPFVLTWHRSHCDPPPAVDAEAALSATEEWWRAWVARCTYEGPWRDAVRRSVVTLKALTYAPTGGIVAAPTTSLPEALGGERNWDYRYCWVRDATFTLYALLSTGYRDEAAAWQDWLLRAAAGRPEDLQIMYGIAGERRLFETTLPWLAGYEGAKPVRIGNAAHAQLQLDVYGELMDALYVVRRRGLQASPPVWRLQCTLLGALEKIWSEPDEGIWEVRGPRRHFTHSRVMAWVAFDRAVKTIERYGCEGPADRWREIRDTIHAEVCRKGFDAKRNTFVQYYGSTALDASLLMIPLVGFLPASDPRVVGTIEAIERELTVDGLVQRYTSDPAVEGVGGREGSFLACTFWLADAFALLGRRDRASAYFHRLLELRNDVGLLAEEYDAVARRQVGNFPQALSHIALVNTAMNLRDGGGPAPERATG